jgi:hypothetical protein
MSKRHQYDYTLYEKVIIGFFKALWWLVKLPFKGFKLGQKGGLSLENRNYIVSKRHEIESSLNSDNELELKHAVMEADKLADHAFKTIGYAGETFADRLRSAQKSIDQSLYNEIWQGHKVRNLIAHEQELRITNNELRQATEKLLKYLKTI